MDDLVAAELTKQLRTLNRWLKLMAFVVLVGFVVIIILVYKVISLTHHLTGNVSNLQQKTEQTFKKNNPF
jgi:ABC-type phosphate/phosphonate transport system permease subunit